MDPPVLVPDHHERGARPSRTTSTRSARGPSTCNATASPGRTLGGQHHAVVFSRREVTYRGGSSAGQLAEIGQQRGARLDHVPERRGGAGGAGLIHGRLETRQGVVER